MKQFHFTKMSGNDAANARALAEQKFYKRYNFDFQSQRSPLQGDPRFTSDPHPLATDVRAPNLKVTEQALRRFAFNNVPDSNALSSSLFTRVLANRKPIMQRRDARTFPRIERTTAWQSQPLQWSSHSQKVLPASKLIEHTPQRLAVEPMRDSYYLEPFHFTEPAHKASSMHYMHEGIQITEEFSMSIFQAIRQFLENPSRGNAAAIMRICERQLSQFNTLPIVEAVQAAINIFAKKGHSMLPPTPQAARHMRQASSYVRNAAPPPPFSSGPPPPFSSGPPPPFSSGPPPPFSSGPPPPFSSGGVQPPPISSRRPSIPSRRPSIPSQPPQIPSRSTQPPIRSARGVKRRLPTPLQIEAKQEREHKEPPPGPVFLDSKGNVPRFILNQTPQFSTGPNVRNRPRQIPMLMPGTVEPPSVNYHNEVIERVRTGNALMRRFHEIEISNAADTTLDIGVFLHKCQNQAAILRNYYYVLYERNPIELDRDRNPNNYRAIYHEAIVPALEGLYAGYEKSIKKEGGAYEMLRQVIELHEMLITNMDNAVDMPNTVYDSSFLSQINNRLDDMVKLLTRAARPFNLNPAPIIPEERFARDKIPENVKLTFDPNPTNEQLLAEAVAAERYRELVANEYNENVQREVDMWNQEADDDVAHIEEVFDSKNEDVRPVEAPPQSQVINAAEDDNDMQLIVEDLSGVPADQLDASEVGQITADTANVDEKNETAPDAPIDDAEPISQEIDVETSIQLAQSEIAPPCETMTPQVAAPVTANDMQQIFDKRLSEDERQKAMQRELVQIVEQSVLDKQYSLFTKPGERRPLPRDKRRKDQRVLDKINRRKKRASRKVYDADDPFMSQLVQHEELDLVNAAAKFIDDGRSLLQNDNELSFLAKQKIAKGLELYDDMMTNLQNLDKKAENTPGAMVQYVKVLRDTFEEFADVMYITETETKERANKIIQAMDGNLTPPAEMKQSAGHQLVESYVNQYISLPEAPTTAMANQSIYGRLSDALIEGVTNTVRYSVTTLNNQIRHEMDEFKDKEVRYVNNMLHINDEARTDISMIGSNWRSADFLTFSKKHQELAKSIQYHHARTRRPLSYREAVILDLIDESFQIVDAPLMYNPKTLETAFNEAVNMTSFIQATQRANLMDVNGKPTEKMATSIHVDELMAMQHMYGIYIYDSERVKKMGQKRLAKQMEALEVLKAKIK